MTGHTITIAIKEDYGGHVRIEVILKNAKHVIRMAFSPDEARRLAAALSEKVEEAIKRQKGAWQ